MPAIFLDTQSDVFQADIYPDAVGDEAALESTEWLEGKNVPPKRV